MNLNSKRIQCDEIWAFVGVKDKNIPVARKDEFGIGSAWTWVAIDDDSKLIWSWLAGKRDPGCATEFIQDLAGRLKNRVQLTTDGLKMYLTAIACCTNVHWSARAGVGRVVSAGPVGCGTDCGRIGKTKPIGGSSGRGGAGLGATAGSMTEFSSCALRSR